MKILNLGSCNIDMTYNVKSIVRSGETVSAYNLQRFPGGKGLNQAVAAARAGAKVFFAGCIGKDGLFLKDLMDESGVDTKYLQIQNENTGHAIIQVDDNSENSIIIYSGANALITKDYIYEVTSNFESGDYLLLQNEIPNLNFIVTTAYKKKMRIVLNPSPYNEVIKKIDFNMLSWLIINKVEAEDITGVSDAAMAIEKLKKSYPNLNIVVTLGEKGCIYTEKGEIKKQSGYKVNAVDTTGAGDTFTGYFVSGISTDKSICDSIKYATVASAMATLNYGAAVAIPYMNDVSDKVKELKTN